MSLMGWSNAEMAARYQHVTDTIRQDVARQVDSLIWRVREGVDAADADGPGEVNGAASDAIVPLDRVRALLAGGADEPGSDGAHTPEGETN